MFLPFSTLRVCHTLFFDDLFVFNNVLSFGDLISIIVYSLPCLLVDFFDPTLRIILRSSAFQLLNYVLDPTNFLGEITDSSATLLLCFSVFADRDSGFFVSEYSTWLCALLNKKFMSTLYFRNNAKIMDLCHKFCILGYTNARYNIKHTLHHNTDKEFVIYYM